MPLTLPYPTYTQFTSSNVHSAEAHNIPHAGLLSNDEYLKNELETTQGDVSTLQTAVSGITYKRVENVRLYGVGRYGWSLPFSTIADFVPQLNLKEYIDDGFDFNNFGTLNWYFRVYSGQSNEKASFKITTSAGVWTVFEEGAYRIGSLAQTWYMFNVKYSLKNYSGLSAAVGNYNNANVTPSGLYTSSNDPLNIGISYLSADASSFSYLTMRQHSLIQVGSGANPVYFQKIICYWDPFATALSYPYIAYWRDDQPSVKVIVPQ